MPKLIGHAQSSFIPGRLSADNIVVVQEAVHSMKKKQGRKGWMLLKLDLEKAYDRLRWDFLEDTLRAAGLSENWVRGLWNVCLVHQCVFCGIGKNLSRLSHQEDCDKVIHSPRTCLSYAWRDYVN